MVSWRGIVCADPCIFSQEMQPDEMGLHVVDSAVGDQYLLWNMEYAAAGKNDPEQLHPQFSFCGAAVFLYGICGVCKSRKTGEDGAEI